MKLAILTLLIAALALASPTPAAAPQGDDCARARVSTREFDDDLADRMDLGALDLSGNFDDLDMDMEQYVRIREMAPDERRAAIALKRDGGRGVTKRPPPPDEPTPELEATPALPRPLLAHPLHPPQCQQASGCGSWTPAKCDAYCAPWAYERMEGCMVDVYAHSRCCCRQTGRESEIVGSIDERSLETPRTYPKPNDKDDYQRNRKLLPSPPPPPPPPPPKCHHPTGCGIWTHQKCAAHCAYRGTYRIEACTVQGYRYARCCCTKREKVLWGTDNDEW